MYEKTLGSQRIYEGRVVTLDVLDVELENGVQSKREVIRHVGAAAVLPRLPDGRFLFIRQFRKALERVMIEVVAGTLDSPGEDPLDCAHRELKEETGYSADRMEHLGATYPSPGYVGERIDLFYAECVGDPEAASMDHDEFVEACPLTADEVEEKIVNGEIVDGKSVAAWWLYEKRIRKG
ncbi:MAG: NUDIX hydrolase [Verrucomicrobiota bacterium]